MEVDNIPVAEQMQMVRHQGPGGKVALEDRAIKAYHEALESGTSEDEAMKQYFEVFKKSTNE